jgi:hypothetical protein
MVKEDETLETFVEKGRLNDWFKGVVQAAKQSAEAELNHITEEGRKLKQMQGELEKIEEGIKEDLGISLKRVKRLSGAKDSDGDLVMDSVE